MRPDPQRACAVGDVPEEGALRVVLGGLPVCVARSGGEVFAISDVCSHADVSLSEGDVEDGRIECWLHGSLFDLRTGAPDGLPAITPVPVYALSRDGDDVLVDVAATAPTTRP